MAAASGFFLFSATALGVAGLLAVFFFSIGRDPAKKARRHFFLIRLQKWALWIALLHGASGLVYAYKDTGLNFALAGFGPFFAGLSILAISMASALVVVFIAMLAGIALARRA